MSNSPTWLDAPTGNDTYPLTGSAGCHCRLRPHGALPIFHPVWTHMRAERANFMRGRDSALNVVEGVDGSPSSHAAPRWAVQHAALIGCNAWQWLPGSCLGRTGGRARGGSPVRPNDHGAMPRQVHRVLDEARAAQAPKRPVKGIPVEALRPREPAAFDTARCPVITVRGRRGDGRRYTGRMTRDPLWARPLRRAPLRPRFG